LPLKFNKLSKFVMVKIKLTGYAKVLLDRIQSEGVDEDEAFVIYTDLLCAISREQILAAIDRYHDRNPPVTTPET
jgi:hypothetical protein